MKWTSVDLSLAAEVAAGPRFGARLQEALRELVRRSVLGPGDALPSTRELADHLGVARGTVVASYEQLTAEGYLLAQPGGRTRVSPAAGVAEEPVPQPAQSARLRFDLRPGVPDLARFPASDWAWAYGEASRRTASAELDYGDGRGHPHLRAVMAAYLRRVRAADAWADRIVIGNGYAQSVSLAISVLAARGARVLAVEDPGDSSIDSIAGAVGMSLAPMPVDEDGLDIDHLAASGADAVVVTPAHQSPTGAVLSAARRIELVAWAERTGGWIIEDDYDSEFRYDRQPIGAVQGLAPERVVLIGSASKTHAPGVRLAWMAVPAALVADVAAARRQADRGGPAVDQLAFAMLVESGRHDKHVRGMRAVYSSRRTRLVEALRRIDPTLSLTGLAAGFHGVLQLPSGLSEDAVIADARDRSLRVVGLRSSTRRRGDLPPSLIIGFGNIDDEALVEALRRLGESLAVSGRG